RARELVFDVGDTRERHADGRVEHLGVDAVDVLVGEPGAEVPAAGAGVVDRAALAQLLRRLAGGAGQADRLGLEPVDHGVLDAVAAVRSGRLHDPGRPVREAGARELADPEVGRLDDMAVGRDHAHRSQRTASLAREHAGMPEPAFFKIEELPWPDEAKEGNAPKELVEEAKRLGAKRKFLARRERRHFSPYSAFPPPS